MELKTRNSFFMNALKNRMVESYNKSNTASKLNLSFSKMYHPPHSVLIHLPPLWSKPKRNATFISLYKSKLRMHSKYPNIKANHKINAVLLKVSKSFCT